MYTPTTPTCTPTLPRCTLSSLPALPYFLVILPTCLRTLPGLLVVDNPATRYRVRMVHCLRHIVLRKGHVVWSGRENASARNELAYKATAEFRSRR